MMNERSETNPTRRIEKGLAARYPLFYVVCREEDRLEGLLSPLAVARCGAPLRVWTRTAGLAGAEGPVEGTRDPL